MPTGGLAAGDAGVALLALRLWARTGDDIFGHLAEKRLSRALAQVPRAGTGLADGTAGVLLVAAEAAATMEPRWWRDVARLIATLAAPRDRPGLHDGTAGILHVLAALHRRPETPDVTPLIAAHLVHLRTFARADGGGIVFPAEPGGPARCDLGFGASGILTALQAVGMARDDPDRTGWAELLPVVLPEPATPIHRVSATRPR